ncbi:MAG: B12-binding domain-containing radical SAM protein [Betaproteobacteria bacterium]
MTDPTIVFYNPLSTTPGKQPLPVSLLSLAAVLEGRRAWTLVDGNVTADPAAGILARLAESGASSCQAAPRPALLAVTVMPGPQLTQAVAVCRAVRRARPDVRVVWGGYFPTQHADTVLRSSFVDFVVRSQGERPFAQLVDALASGTSLDGVSALSWTCDGRIVHNPAQPPVPLDDLPDLPYDRVRMDDYIHPNYLGRRTVAHNSSFGCPFACSFCAVVAMSGRRWMAQSPARIERVLRHLVTRYGVDAVQMHDMDFFISEARAAETAERIAPLGLGWWALGRIDTLMQYSDATWQRLAASGLRMVFSGAESASAATLAAMNKGGKAAPELAVALARRLRQYGIVPEFSFVLGSPPEPLADMAQTFEFIRTIKRVNPATEIVLYTYTPVPGGAMTAEAARLGFSFPSSLDEWASDDWRRLMMRRGDGIPWMDDAVRRRVRNFERVLNAYYPTVTDRRLTRARRALLRTISTWRYRLRIYAAPYELRALHRLIAYQRPETTGF